MYNDGNCSIMEVVDRDTLQLLFFARKMKLKVVMSISIVSIMENVYIVN